MKRIPPIAGFVGSVTTIIGLVFGDHVLRWEMYACLGCVILFSLALLTEQRANELNRKQIQFQAQVIQYQGQFIGEILTKDFGGQE